MVTQVKDLEGRTIAYVCKCGHVYWPKKNWGDKMFERCCE